MLPIVIGGLVLLGAAVLYVIVRKTGSRTAGLFTAVLLLVVPFADEALGRIQFNRLCSTEGGYSISREVETDGYLDGTPRTGCNDRCKAALVKKGFRYVEVDVRDPRLPVREKTIYRFSLIRGDLVAARLPAPSAPYEFVLAERSPVTPSPVRIERLFSRITDRRTGEVAGKATSFVIYGGGWLSNSLSSHITGRSCPAWPDSHGPVMDALRPRQG